METTQKVAKKLGVVPRISLGTRELVPGEVDKSGNPKTVVKPTGAHLVEIVSDSLVDGFDNDGKPRQELRFLITKEGMQYRWQFPIYSRRKNAKGEWELVPHYLIEKTMNLKPGDKVILEMRKFGAKTYISVTRPGEVDDEAPHELSDEVEEGSTSTPGVSLADEQRLAQQ